MAKPRTTDKLTPSGKKLMKQFKLLKNRPHVRVGVLQENFSDPKEGDPERDFTLGEVAVVNEFGSSDGRIPERSYIRSTHDDKKDAWRKLTNQLRRRMIEKTQTVAWVLGNVGEEIVANIKEKIDKLKDPPNAASTIAAKTRDGKVGDNPLINFGQLRQSITEQVHGTDK